MIIRRIFTCFCAVPLLVGACSDNPPSRVIESYDQSGGGGVGGSGGSPDNPVPSAGGEANAGAGAEVPDAGSEGGAPGGAAGAAGESALSPEEQAKRDFEKLYAERCPDQPDDVMMPRGPAEVIADGESVPSTPTRPQITSGASDDVYSIRNYLRAGGVYSVTYTGDAVSALEPTAEAAGGAAGAANAGMDGSSGAGGAAGAPESDGGRTGPLGQRIVTYDSYDNWYPLDEIEDVTKIIPGRVVDPEGNGTNTTIQSAIGEAVVVAGCPRVFIKIMPGTYHEKITVPAKTSSPPVTLYGMDSDPSQVVIVAGHSAAGAEDDGTPLTIHASATFTNSLPHDFQARNLTIVNNYVAGTYPGDADSQTAVALLNQGDKAEFDNVHVLGHRHAAYVKSTASNEVARAYFRDCYIEGDEDMILGRGTGVFDGCEIHSLGDRVSTGAVTSASTRLTNPYGFLIINSELTADDGVSDVYLGHSWYEGEDDEAVGKVIIRNSILGEHIRTDAPWAPVERVTPKNPMAPEPTVLYTSDDYYAPMTGLVPAEVFLAEFGNTGPGAAE